MNRTQKLNEWLGEQKERGMRYLYLSDKLSGDVRKRANCIIHPANTTGKVQQNFEEEVSALLNYVDTHPNSNFVVGVARVAPRSAEQIELIQLFPVTMDDQPAPKVFEQPTVTMKEAENARSLEQTIADKTEIAKLKFELKLRDQEIDRLNAEIEQLEEQLNDNDHAQMADSVSSKLAEYAPLLPGLVDKWFAMQREKMELLRNAARPVAPAPAPAPQQQQNTNGHEWE